MVTKAAQAPALVTAEELIVYAASRDLPPPPGVLPVVEALDSSAARDMVLAQAARTLITRGVDTSPSGVTAPRDVEELMRVACLPRSRVVVVSGDGPTANFFCFSLGDDFCVIQTWSQFNLHALLPCALDDVLTSIHNASRVHGVGKADSEASIEVSNDARNAAVTEGDAALEALVDAHAQNIASPDIKRSLVQALKGTGAGTSLMFNRIQGDAWADAFGWVEPGSSGAWFVHNNVLAGATDADGGSGVLTIRRVGGDQLREATADRFKVALGG